MNFLKTTVIGGLVFLVPLGMLAVVLSEIYDVMAIVAEPMAESLPIDSLGGIAVANIIAILFILLVGFGAGLVARTRRAQKFAESMENKILQKIPGYSLIRGMTSSLAPEKAVKMHAVLVSLGYSSRLGLETDRTEEGDVIVYFPGSPNALSGEVHIVKSDQVTPVDRPVLTVMEHAEQLGGKTGDILADLG